MKVRHLFTAIAALVVASHWAETRAGDPLLDPPLLHPTPFVSAQRAHADRVAARHAAHLAWNRGYYHTAWGEPVALVVPPTAHMESRWGWGVAQDTVTPIYHRFGRAYPGPFEGDGTIARPTPRWPSHTDQFGVYYIRGPWW